MIFKAGRGRKAALTSAVLGLAVLALAGFTLQERIREEWWLHRLESKDGAVRLQAAEELARIGSPRAIPRLLRHSTIIHRVDPAMPR